ncbi:MAG: UbiA prenyltransferase family protein [Lachnospiraceae bacterium]|jgi:4-hydroxybenzoate polyprenyltransferase|nr:UbiA prenyltransferase family protein [Lachnospiraceae bacterium]
MNVRLQLLRVKHYIKNLLIFTPLFFARQLLDKDVLVSYIVPFIAFCLAASIIYITNDICDLEKDKLHPEKQKRPIASGKISCKEAGIWIIGLFLIEVALCFFNSAVQNAIGWIVIYVAINLFYSYGGKNIPIVDVILLASGFVIRVMYGAKVGNIEVSVWLNLTIWAFSLYLGMGKRMKEVMLQNKDETRKVLRYYSAHYLGNMMHMCMTMTVLFYALWSTNVYGNSNAPSLMVWTVPLIIVIIMRYEMQIEDEKTMGDPINVLLKDKYLLILTLVYILLSGILIYR